MAARALPMVVALLALGGCATAGSAQRPPEPLPVPASMPAIDAVRLTDVLGLQPLLAELDAAPAGSAEATAARQSLLERVLQASLEADDALAKLQGEEAVLQELQSAVQSQHDSQVGSMNLAAGLFGVSAAVGTALTAAPNPTPGIWIAAVGGGVAASVAMIAALTPASGRLPLRTSSAMLAPFLAPQTAPGGYPPIVWQCLTTAPMGGRAPREQLLDQWRRLGRISPMPSATELQALAGSLPLPGDTTTSTLQTRILMLADVRAHISALKRGLAELLARGQGGARSR
jgi:hypothetical protein